MVKVVPSILTQQVEIFKEKINLLEGKVDRVQIDVIDGQFADNKTVDLAVLANLETSLKLDFHLMVKNPIDWVEKVFRVGADTIIGQIEMMDDQFQFLGKVQEVGCQMGFALDLDSPLEKINPEIWGSLDYLLIMGVKAGFGGQEFNREVLYKIAKADKIKKEQNFDFVIGVDGGVNLSLKNEIIKAGANELIIGERLFTGDLTKNLEDFAK